jgi:hypothetical protein
LKLTTFFSLKKFHESPPENSVSRRVDKAVHSGVECHGIHANHVSLNGKIVLKINQNQRGVGGTADYVNHENAEKCPDEFQVSSRMLAVAGFAQIFHSIV